jgi:hypothetical protein
MHMNFKQLFGGSDPDTALGRIIRSPKGYSVKLVVIIRVQISKGRGKTEEGRGRRGGGGGGHNKVHR